MTILPYESVSALSSVFDIKNTGQKEWHAGKLREATKLAPLLFDWIYLYKILLTLQSNRESFGFRPCFRCVTDMPGRAWDNMSFRIEKSWGQFIVHTNCSIVDDYGNPTRLENATDYEAIKWLVESVEEVVDHFVDTYFRFIADSEIGDRGRQTQLWNECEALATCRR